MAAVGGNSSVIPAPTPNHLLFRLLPSLLVHLQVPRAHHCCTIRAKHMLPHPTVQNHPDSDCRRMFAPLAVMVLTLPVGFYEVMKSLIVHSQWPWAPCGWIRLLNNWDVDRKCIRQIDDEMKPVFGSAQQLEASSFNSNVQFTFATGETETRPSSTPYEIMRARQCLFVCLRVCVCVRTDARICIV